MGDLLPVSPLTNKNYLMNDQKIITLFKEGQREKAFRNLYRYYPKIEKMVRSYGGTKDDALDVFQEALIVVYNNLRKEQFELTCSFYTYLYAVSRYIWKDANKQSKKEPPEIPDLEDSMEQEQRYQTAEKAFAKLGEKCKELLTLFYHKKMAFKKIAESLGFASEKVAKNQKYKCLVKAKAIYQENIKSVLS